MKKPQLQDRRSFFRWALAGLGSLGLSGFFYASLRFLSAGLGSNQRRGSGRGAFYNNLAGSSNLNGESIFAAKAPDGKYEISIDALPQNDSVILALGVRPVTVLHASDRFRVFDATCTHFGCLVKWDPNKQTFGCPCHGGIYNAEGKNQAGPPPYALKEHDVVQEDGKLRISAA